MLYVRRIISVIPTEAVQEIIAQNLVARRVAYGVTFMTNDQNRPMVQFTPGLGRTVEATGDEVVDTTEHFIIGAATAAIQTNRKIDTCYKLNEPPQMYLERPARYGRIW